jgi:tetratricopeptide (TPR) repeat protein
MKEFTAVAVLTFIFSYTLGQFGYWGEFKKRAKHVHHYEYKALELAKTVRLLKKKNEELKLEVTKLKSEKEHLEMSLNNKSRTIASIPKKSAQDLVNFEVFKWSADKLLGIGEQKLHFKKYEASAQYYNTLIQEYPKHKIINDKVLFEAGIAAYESKKHYPWAINHFGKIVSSYPKSKLYRGAKLWLALSHYRQGNTQKFMDTYEEFRAKYRNTKEWQVLSRYYEDIAYKYKK